MASDSAQFPLGRPMGTPNNADPASGDGVRPWGLRGMSTLSGKKFEPVPAWRYDHAQQVAVDLDGRALNELRMDPSADSVTDGDGDEGRAEDFVYDFAPDAPVQPV
ncbi:putative ATP-grasp-modified RiPP [Saccharopolyspora hattusasensis]|uniref:putative ATP-grasp-modified RiPP n=1 Tax=Saccharopolyspora hattusasensis TaxID=1128679 RepID=UPI003D9768DF